MPLQVRAVESKERLALLTGDKACLTPGPYIAPSIPPFSPPHCLRSPSLPPSLPCCVATLPPGVRACAPGEALTVRMAAEALGKVARAHQDETERLQQRIAELQAQLAECNAAADERPSSR